MKGYINIFEATDVALWSDLPDLDEDVHVGHQENPHGVSFAAPDPKDDDAIRTYHFRAKTAEEITDWYHALLNSTQPRVSLAQRAYNAKTMTTHASSVPQSDTQVQLLIDHRCTVHRCVCDMCRTGMPCAHS